jgi:dTDP-4-dehydrorhamnose 3,5-epimerase
MIYRELPLAGALVIDLDRIEDARGFFARAWCRREFAERGLDVQVAQCNLSYNAARGTLRGMHYQLPPRAETKLVRCIRGALYDVIADLRPDSPTFLRWTGVELTAGNRSALYVPKGFAHGFQTLEDDTEVLYQMSEFYAPELGRGLRWNDPLLGIAWPLPAGAMSDKDAAYADCGPDQFAALAGL